ncbi:MAG: helix-turn-helix domain-containing protein [Solirubrobacterales bacterium]|nr:helix-turn-helix domain-containing protein [Solirubrobacterales bacterium]
MDVAGLIKRARGDARLSQAELARRGRTTQPAVAAYESGAKTPGIATLERLLGACEHDLALSAVPRVRRGAASLRQIAEQMREDFAGDRRSPKQSERDALRLLFGFADDFRASSEPGKAALIAEEPPLTGDPRFDAALAGAAELFASEAAIHAPQWVDAPARFVEPWWFVSTRPAFDAYTLAHTPAVFARHGVFLAREVFDRV